MGFSDLHIHTTYSWDGTCPVPAVLKYAADFTNLDVIAITDHDCILGALEAVRLAPRYGIEVIPGCEISTADGHLLGLFIHKAIPAGLSLVETVMRVGEQGGICIAAHPGARVKRSIPLQTLRQCLDHPGVREVLVGIECFNAGLVYSQSNRQANALAEELGVARVGNSDTHVLDMIGWGATEFPGYSPFDLRHALQQRTTRPYARRSTTGLEKIIRWVPSFLLRRLGWVITNHNNPCGPLRLGRLEPIPGDSSLDALIAPKNI